MRILVTGANGTLGSALIEVLSSKHEVVGLTRKDLDLELFEQTIPKVTGISPDLIIHTAAYTDVDGCEKQPDKAYRINWLGTLFLSQAALNLDIPIVYISTDYVFDGEKGNYLEHDHVNPIQVYGRSKLYGELAVLQNAPKHYIVRTSWVYGPRGRNFFSKLPILARENSYLRVVNDQVNCPTYSYDLAEMLSKFIELKPPFGIYHITGRGATTPFEFTKFFVETAGLDTNLQPVKSESFKRPARRPKNTTLKNFALEMGLGLSMPHWKDGVRRFVEWLRRSGEF